MQDSNDPSMVNGEKEIIKKPREIFLVDGNRILLIIDTLGVLCFAGDLAGFGLMRSLGVMFFLFSFPAALVLVIVSLYAIIRDLVIKTDAGARARIKILVWGSISTSLIAFVSSIMGWIIPSGKNMQPFIWLFLLFMGIEFIILVFSQLVYIRVLKHPKSEGVISNIKTQRDDKGLLTECAELVLIYGLLALLFSWRYYSMMAWSVEHHIGSGLIEIPLMFLGLIFTIIATIQAIKTIMLYLKHHVQRLPFPFAHCCCALGMILTTAAIFFFVSGSVAFFNFGK